MKRVSRVNKSNQVPNSVLLKLSRTKQKLSVKPNKSIKIKETNIKPLNSGNSTNKVSEKSFSHPEVVIENKNVEVDRFSFFAKYKKPFEACTASANVKALVKQLKVNCNRKN